MSRAWAGGSTRAWRKIRLAVLRRDHELCRLRLPGICTIHATEVHHVHGRAITGDDPRFLVAACSACNNKLGDPQQNKDPKPQPRTKW